MLEAVNSTLSNAPLVRVTAEQQSTARSLTANPEKVQLASQAPYISPYIQVDVNYDKAVILIRDRDTGDAVRQIPSEPALEAARRQIAAQAHGDQYQVSDRVAPTPQETKQVVVQQPQTYDVPDPAPQPQPQQQAQVAPTPQVATASYGAFAKQVASLQTAAAGEPSTGGTVSISA